jgi:polyadenylate-binding protein
MLYLLFNDYSISYIKIAKDHETSESFGYAFIGFSNINKAEEAMNKLNYSKLAKKTIRISWYNREPQNYRNKIENNIFVKKIPKDITQKEFHDYFKKFGNIVSSKIAEDEEGESMGFGFVLYDSEENAKNAIKECNGQIWNGKKIYVSQFIKNRPKKPLKFNNVYVRNIPKDWSENEVKKYFSKFGEIGSMIVKLPEKDKLSKEIPEKKLRQILNHKFAFICYKSLDGPAEKVISKVPFLKISDQKYNTKIEELAKKVYSYGVKVEDIYKLACYILDNDLEGEINNKEDLNKNMKSFTLLIKENDGIYKAKNQDNRLFCCQALKKSERNKKIKLLYEKIKKKIKEKYKFCNLYIKNLPNDYTDEKLKELFGKFGKIRSAKVVKKEIETFYLVPKKVIKVFGFVCYYEPIQAQEAKKNLKELSLLGNGPKLYIDYHQTKKERASFLKLKFIKISQKQKNIPKIPIQMPYLKQFREFMNFLQMQNKPRIIQNNMREFSEKNNNSMDSNARNEYFGEKLYNKISKISQFDKYANYFSKIVGIFLDLDDNVLDKLINDDQYFVEQINETIKLLSEKDNPN